MTTNKYISSYWTDGKPSNGIGQNKGRKTAIGYFENKRAIMSLPAHLNNYKLPDFDDVAAILAGDAMTAFNRAVILALAEKMNADSLDWCALPANDEFILLAEPCGIYIVDAITHEQVERVADSWQVYMLAVNLAKTPAPQYVAHLVAMPDAPQESNAAILARTVETVRRRRLAGMVAA